MKDYQRFILVFLFFFLCLGLMYFTVDRFISLDDQFFHIRFAELIKEKGLDAFKDFKWLYFSRIAQEQTYFENYHFLFYLVLIPFTLFSPLHLGIKFYGVIFGALAFWLLYYFLKKIGEKYPLFWTVFVFAVFSIRLLLRFVNARPFTIAPALLLIFLYLLYRRQYIWALVLSSVYFGWHSPTFFLTLVVAGVYFLIVRLTAKKTDWKLVVYPLLGTVLAFLATLLFAPHFLKFMKDVTFSVIYRTLLFGKENLIEGTELYPVDYFTFIRPSVIIFGLLVVAFGFELFSFFHRRKQSAGDLTVLAVDVDDKRALRLTLLAMTVIFLLGTFFVRRNSDYFVFFSGAYLAMAVNLLLANLKFDNLSLQKFLAGACIVLVAFLFIDNLVLARSLISQAQPHELIEGAASWLKNNAGKNEVIFNVSRDDFPTLFYYNQNNYYITGLEARLLYDYSPRLYWLWWHISSQGQACAEPVCHETSDGGAIAQVIAKDFQSKYVISNFRFDKLNGIMSQSAAFKLVYEDSYYSIYQIVKMEHGGR